MTDTDVPLEPINLRLPSKYIKSSESSPSPDFTAPSEDFFHRTWIVTHSTLSMWRTSRNVRITYTPLSPSNTSKPSLPLDDLVEYETGSGKVKRIPGIDRPDTKIPGAWNWRGKGWLSFASSHWEILGWGEIEGGKEKWVVTWFAPTIFTSEGVDVYCDRKEGISEETYGQITEALEKLGQESGGEVLGNMVAKDMQAVEIRLPWVDGK